MATDELKEKFVGKWKLYKNENIDAFFSDVGVNFLVRKMIAAGSPEQTISLDGDIVTIHVDAGFRKRDETYKLGEEVDKTTENGEEGKAKLTYENGKIILTQTPLDKNSKTTIVTRERVGDEMCLEMKRGDIVAKRWFRKM